ncbi:hypothetical protein FNV43_RR14033 [Rhamnella rubrinervis]|uniref:Amino acid transporter transmembrane domain-containing protein n=1 Tax=Rhamnella rubrinervis TaxID=2594499 RepID=A0A8K0H284_9ROSA|nr:hypothetical protein FNV43_RR14033 [Rhamnella rubrinervis]
MEAKRPPPAAGDEFPLTLPLLVDEKHNGMRCKIEEYDTSPGTASFSKTCFNGVNALTGVGMLSVPYAISSGGWLSLFLFVMASIAFYTGLLIQRCMDLDPDIRSYPDIGERAFGNKGRLVLSILMSIELYLCAVGFLILEGDNLYNLFPDVGFEVGGLTIRGKQCFVVMSALIIFPSLWLDSLSFLSYISAGGVFASVIILGSVLWTGAFDDGIGFHQKEGYSIGVVSQLLLACMLSVTVIIQCFPPSTLPCKTNVTSPSFGYLMFGSGVESQITLNLPTGKVSSKVAIYTTLVTPIAKYALTITPIVDAAKTCFPSHVNKRLFGLFVSITLLISTVMVALVLPFLQISCHLLGHS